MDWKRIAKRLLPPIALESLNRLQSYKNGTRSGYAWEGIYRNYNEAPRSGPAFEGDIWLDARRRNFERQLHAISDRKTSAKFVDEDTLLPFLVSIISAETDKIRILEFGGGLGESYLDLKSVVDPAIAIDYHVVEMARTCAQGLELFHGDHGIHFHSELPARLPAIDVVYVRSALQYVEDYAGLLRQLCAYSARFVLFVKLSAGNIPTFATAQRNLRGSTIPYWFINIRQLIQIMADAGYLLVFKNNLAKEYDQENFPEAYRLKHACNMLFARTTEKLFVRDDEV